MAAPAASAPPPLPSFSFAASALANREEEKVNYLELPQPVRYEDIQRESSMALKPELFEGMRFELNKPLNPNFFLSHSMFMGNVEMPTGGKQIVKTPIGNYEFGANVINEKYMFLGRIATDGRLSGRIKYDVADWLSLKVQTQIASEAGQSQLMADADLKGSDWNAQLKVGNPGFYGLNYFQSVTPTLSVGGEFFWLQPNLKSGVGFAARHATPSNVATLQVATTGILSMQYTHRVTEKISLASDLMWHFASREATATIGYDCMLRQCRLRGKVDSNGVISTLLEERFAPGINFVLSAELDHGKSNYKFGFGIVAGE
nr:mitochondrial import receptor subunit TOM40-1 (TOM40-1) [Polytomella parva]